MSKNVLFIHYVSCMGGAERYLLSLIEALDPSYKVSFICQEPGPLSDAIKATGAHVSFMPLRGWRKARYFFQNLLTIKELIDFCRTNQIDLICSNNYRIAAYAVWPARFLHIPAVTIIQDFASQRKLWKFNTFESDVLVTVSKSIASTADKSFKKEIFPIYNGIDAAAFIKSAGTEDTLRKEFPQLQGKRVVGMIAHIIPLKGHKVFLEAMQNIAQQFDDVMFVIIGHSLNPKEFSEEDLKSYANQLGIADRVVFTGGRPNVACLLKSFDIFVHPSNREAFGRVVMEAMTLSVPVVVTDCGGPREIIEDQISGILVPVGDSEQMARGVKMLLSHEAQRKEMAKQGRIRIEKFDLKATVGRINVLFDKILKKE